MMRSPLFLSSISNTIIISVILVFSSNVFADTDDILYRVNLGLYNPKTLGEQEDYFKSYLNFGIKYGISEQFNINFDGYISDETDAFIYAGTSLDYIYSISDDYSVFVRAGVDFADNNAIPKAGFGFITELSNNSEISFGNIFRHSDTLSEYQFELGFAYRFGAQGNDSHEELTSIPVAPNTPVDKNSFLELSSTVEVKEFNAASDYYMVKSGDTLWGIANKFNVRFISLLEINPNIENPDLIYPKEIILLNGDYVE